MAYSARIVHKSNGRLRLQMDDPNVTNQALREALVQLQSLSMAQKVRANPLTRTIVMENEDDQSIQEVLEKAEEQGVLHIHANAASLRPSESIGERIHGLRVRIDGFLNEVSDGSLDFKKALALTFAGVGLKQSISGKFLPAGLTLIFYAVGMLELDEIDRRSRETI